MHNEKRLINMRLGWFRYTQECSYDVAKTCRYFGISRPTYYRWHNRYVQYGIEGLNDKSKRPFSCPKETKKQIIEKILYLRRRYHFGPYKIQMYLKRYHDISIVSSTIWRILKRAGMSRLPAYQRYRQHKERFKRYEKALPGQRIQVDVKFLSKITDTTHKRYYQFTAIDDCSRLRIMKIYTRNNQKNAIDFIDYVLSQLPFAVQCIQTDNGSEFQSQFHWHLLDKGIKHVYIKPRTPRLNGKVERSHRIDDEEFYNMLNGVVIDTAATFNQRLIEWQNFYNYQRPHGSLNGKTPFEKLQQKIGSVCNASVA